MTVRSVLPALHFGVMLAVAAACPKSQTFDPTVRPGDAVAMPQDSGPVIWQDASLADTGQVDAAGGGDAAGPASPDAAPTTDAAERMTNDGGGGITMDGGTVDAGGLAGTPDSGTGPASCTIWQECPPHFDDPNSAFECQGNLCLCDPTGHWQTECGSIGGYLTAYDCYCVLGAGAPPSEDPDPDDSCRWEWEYYCEEDRWVDTSHYERRCETVNGETQCHDEWVSSGYWEDGGCNHVRWVWKCH
jgi:hypothetical protein